MLIVKFVVFVAAAAGVNVIVAVVNDVGVVVVVADLPLLLPLLLLFRRFCFKNFEKLFVDQNDSGLYSENNQRR